MPEILLDAHLPFSFNMPDASRLDILQPAKKPVFLPDYLAGAADAQDIIKAALEHPVGMDRLDTLVNPASRIAVIVDDITRATPTNLILGPVLDILEKSGVKDSNISILFANGSHRTHSCEEKEYLLGKDVFNRYNVYEHDAHDSENLKLFGHTKRGTPVLVNKIAAEADLRIMTGMIKPHCQAAYSGGGKSILPGVSGIETIIRDHNYEAVKYGKLGSIDGNPIRSDIEEAAGMVGPCFIINVVLNAEKQIVGAVAGDMIKAHRLGCRIFDSMCRFGLKQPVDIGIALCKEPVDISFYQAIGGIAPFVKTSKPVLKKNGIIILLAKCREGMGHSIFARYNKEKVKSAVRGGLSNSSFEEGQWGVQVLAECMDYADIIVVSDDKIKPDIESLGMLFADSAQEAFKIAMKRMELTNPDVLVLPDAPYTIVDLED